MQAKEIEIVTLEEFQTMAKDDRYHYELIDGIVMMSPSPTREHQFIGSRLISELDKKLENTPCQPAYELDVIMKTGDVLQPDVMVFCDEDAELPEIVVEILSPSSKRYDLVTKVIKYEEVGVKEYWIVDQKSKTITVHDFVHQTAEIYSIGETIRSLAQPALVIDVAIIFANKKLIYLEQCNKQ